jgi:hypothetical protein
LPRAVKTTKKCECKQGGGFRNYYAAAAVLVVISRRKKNRFTKLHDDVIEVRRWKWNLCVAVDMMFPASKHKEDRAEGVRSRI